MKYGPLRNGFSDCNCDPCSCRGACGGDDDQEHPRSLNDLLDSTVEIPPTGIALAAAPSPERLGALEQATYRGVVADNAYFAGGVGLVVYADGTARAFPLESPGKFALRGCRGQFIARFYRQSQSTDA